jgi:GT2 family glycosyltransferase
VLSSACIIPVVGTTDGLENTLVSVLERRPDHCEVIVVLNTAYDDPFDLQSELQFIHAPAKTGLVGCINFGIAAAAAPIVHLLASGFEAGDGWLETATAHFADPRVAAVTPLIYDAAERDRMLAAGVGYVRGGRRVVCQASPDPSVDSPRQSIGPAIVAASYRKAALAAVGGGLTMAVGDRLADVDLALTLSSAGWVIATDPSCRVYGAAIDQPRSSGFMSGMWSERLFWRHAKHRGLIAEMLAHPVTAFSDSLRGAPFWRMPAQALGRLIAICQFGHYAVQRQVFAAAKAQAEAAQNSTMNSSKEIAVEATTRESKPQRRLDPPHRKSRTQENRAAGSALSTAGRRSAGS